MRFIRRTTVNPRDPRDYRLYVSQTNDIVMGGRASLQLPVGADADRSAAINDGLIRFNTDSESVEVYQGGAWRSLRYTEATKIIQQTIGTGNGCSVYFGPLNVAYNPTKVASDNDNFDGQNLLVYIENVPQLWTTNYTIEQNPVTTLTAAGTNNSGATTINVTPTNNASTGFADKLPDIKIGDIVTANDGGAVFDVGTTVQTVGTSSFTVNNPTLLNMTAATTITLTRAGSANAGYWIKFTSAATLSKAITILHGFDK
jgi:hypothetical protein